MSNEMLTATPEGPAFPPEERMDELLRRLSRLELLIVSERMQDSEGNELTDDDEPNTAVAAARAVPVETFSLADELDAFIDALGFPNFKGREFTPYWSRVRNGVRNSVPPRHLWPNIVPTLAVLQRFRTEIGRPVQLLSTYRSPAYNQAVGGATRSLHLQFRAVDFTVSAGNPAQWAARLRGYRGQKFDDPHTGTRFEFHGGIGVYTGSNFVHLDTRGSDVDW